MVVEAVKKKTLIDFLAMSQTGVKLRMLDVSDRVGLSQMFMQV